jgi:hypothetical protein
MAKMKSNIINGVSHELTPFITMELMSEIIGRDS